jgi:membrane-associated phospholipid phosphatase
MRPVDSLLLGFLGLLAMLTAIFVPAPWMLLAAELAMAAPLLVAARLRARWSWLDVVHAFLPVPILAELLNLVGPVLARANAARWDAQLAACDARYLAPLVAAWKNAGGRPGWLTDFASAAYASYYLLPVVAAGLLWAKRRFEEFDRYVFSVSAVLLASYAAYFIAPAAGPRVPAALAQAELGGGAVSAALRTFLRAAETNQLDAFPSGHTAVSLVFVAEAWRLFPRLRAPLALAVGAIIFSTVYLSFHYAIDVAAGAALALLMLAVLPRLRSAFGFRSGEARLNFSPRRARPT